MLFGVSDTDTLKNILISIDSMSIKLLSVLCIIILHDFFLYPEITHGYPSKAFVRAIMMLSIFRGI